MSDVAFSLGTHPVHLGLGATVVRLPEFDGTMEWYERYGASVRDDAAEGRLVSLHTFRESWPTWEIHPNGEELVVCIRGTMTLHQELDGKIRTVLLTEGQAIINPKGVWHTADIDGEATALFVTAGLGTEQRAR